MATKKLKIIEFSYDPNPSEVKGFYDEDVPGYIYIRQDLTGIIREVVTAHESQHAKCHKTRCKCFDLPSDFLREYHAFMAELDFMCSEIRTWDEWFEYINTVCLDLERYKEKKVWLGHFKALAKVCRLRRFQRVAEVHMVYKQIMKLVSEKKK